MNGKAARLVRKFCAWAGVTQVSLQRQRKRAWKAMNHKQRGAARRKIENAMRRDPRIGKLATPHRQAVLK